jgi:hypothetical protein
MNSIVKNILENANIIYTIAKFVYYTYNNILVGFYVTSNLVISVLFIRYTGYGHSYLHALVDALELVLLQAYYLVKGIIRNRVGLKHNQYFIILFFLFIFILVSILVSNLLYPTTLLGNGDGGDDRDSFLITLLIV